MTGAILAALACAIWTSILLLPWRPWSTRERLDAPAEAQSGTDLSDVSVLIPARNEAAVIGTTLEALAHQGPGLSAIVVDDQSQDGTAEAARRTGLPGLSVVTGAALPNGWSGKPWALEQARKNARTRYLLLLDADIALKPNTIATLKEKAAQGFGLVSLMAELRMANAWEQLLMPAFVYFFKLLYPFALANSRSPWVAAAAGGCILIEAPALEAIGGFASLKGALIDDCTLARKIKNTGVCTFIGLTHSAVSLRPYPRFADIWNMVARSAYTQLHYSPLLLIAVSAVFLVACAVPPLALVAFPGALAKGLAAAALGAMALGYLPTLLYYRRSPLLALAMPAIGALFLAMTWSSALRYGRGRRSEWKGRIYGRASL